MGLEGRGDRGIAVQVAPALQRVVVPQVRCVDDLAPYAADYAHCNGIDRRHVRKHCG